MDEDVVGLARRSAGQSQARCARCGATLHQPKHAVRREARRERREYCRDCHGEALTGDPGHDDDLE